MFGKCYEDLTPRLAIHPAQVGPIIEVFTPTEEEVEQTQTLIAAYETYQAAAKVSSASTVGWSISQ